MRPKPVCPVCGCGVRRDLDEDPDAWKCDLHGFIRPRWEFEEDDE
jgi:hypothetical protein